MIDLKIDQITGDLVIEAFDLTLATDAAGIAQHVLTRLRTFLGEWFLDRTVGVPYFKQVLTKPVDASILNAIFKSVILETPGVRKLTRFSMDLNAALRELTVIFAADTDLGEIQVEETLP